VDDCSAALELEPENVKALLRRAAASAALGEHEAAVRDHEEAARVAPETPGVRQGLADAKRALKASKPAGAPVLSDAQLTEKVTQRVTSTRAEGNQGPRRGNDQVRAKVGAAIASTLGITTAELKAAHKAGTTPATLASQKGVAKADLVAAVSTVLKANKPANAPAMTDAQLTQKATNIVDGVHPGPGGPGGSHSQGRR
jgi:hypothetical protein